MTAQANQVWDIRYVYGGRQRGFCWEIFCRLHDEVDGICPHPEEAIEHAEYLNEQERGPQMRTRRATNSWTDESWQVVEHWEHTPRPGHPAGWQQ
jgi:hypothetical protein